MAQCCGSWLNIVASRINNHNYGSMLYALIIIIIMAQFAAVICIMHQYGSMLCIRHQYGSMLCIRHQYGSKLCIRHLCCVSGINVGVHHTSIWLVAGASTAQRYASGITIYCCVYQALCSMHKYGSMMCIRHRYGFMLCIRHHNNYGSSMCIMARCGTSMTQAVHHASLQLSTA